MCNICIYRTIANYESYCLYNFTTYLFERVSTKMQERRNVSE